MAINYAIIVAGTSAANADTGGQLAQKINENFACTKTELELLKNCQVKAIQIVLNKNQWNVENKTQLVTNSNINSQSCNTYFPILPDINSTELNILTTNYDTYLNCGIRAIHEGTNNVLFKADTIPTIDIVVVVKIEAISCP